ncbi:hypothetical protein LY625_04745 [Lysobacter sp. GX 14042]|uniref:hypothetical protein n=1 Tax=Lysobacter sp. GX 14042 TaxID=2907155 RepID=UPI001F24C549|nr:hypothetical protein [Lysobacter sp. GX 14042]MCE7031931.1 hypothetical protein [Lysobacter sp. GX 14042]
MAVLSSRLGRPRTGALAVLAAAALLPAATWVPPAHAQVRQCAGPDGRAVFTDRSCEDVGARAAAAGATAAGQVLHTGCARNVRELVWEVSAAIDLGDVNRLAGVYHWTGMTGRSGNEVMNRLQALVGRPLLHVAPVVQRRAPRAWSVLDDGRRATTPAPVALQLEQLQPGGDATRTTFNLHQHFGCVWLAG